MEHARHAHVPPATRLIQRDLRCVVGLVLAHRQAMTPDERRRTRMGQDDARVDHACYLPRHHSTPSMASLPRTAAP